MKLFVLGASGLTGQEFVTQARAAGHQLTAYVRDPAGLTAGPDLAVVAGSVTDSTAMAAAMTGHEAVVSMLGSGRRTTTLIDDTTRGLVPAADQVGVRRVVVLSAFGVGESFAKAGRVARLAYRTATRGVFADKARGEAVLRASDLDWTLAYPVTLTNKPATGAITATPLEDTGPVPGMPTVSRADVASFLLQAATTDSYRRQIVVLR